MLSNCLSGSRYLYGECVITWWFPPVYAWFSSLWQGGKHVVCAFLACPLEGGVGIQICNYIYCIRPWLQCGGSLKQLSFSFVNRICSTKELFSTQNVFNLGVKEALKYLFLSQVLTNFNAGAEMNCVSVFTNSVGQEPRNNFWVLA